MIRAVNFAENFSKIFFRYNEDIQGAIVAYDSKSMRPVQSTASLQNSPGDAYLHFTIKADIVLFAPKPNMYLTGECTEVSFYDRYFFIYIFQITDSYISCLVCSIFNCTIPLIDAEGRRFQKDSFGLGDQIKFKVDKVRFDFGLRIRKYFFKILINFLEGLKSNGILG